VLLDKAGMEQKFFKYMDNKIGNEITKVFGFGITTGSPTECLGYAYLGFRDHKGAGPILSEAPRH
jgi:hypothetical protein